MSVHDVPDSSKPETWKWMFSLTWPDEGSSVPRDPKEMKQQWTDWAEKLAEPFSSAYLAIAPSATFWCDRLAEWRTKTWDNRNGRITLAGDAAHPMTYRKPRPLNSCSELQILIISAIDRGQGLNNGILDAAYLCRALSQHARGEKPITEVLTMYEKEMQERGREAVISSGENSLMIHDWKRLKLSPIFTMGLKALEKSK